MDLFVCSSGYVDLASIGILPHHTGGRVYRYPHFKANVDGNKLVAELAHVIKREHGFEAMMRVRTSTGLRPVDFYGPFTMNNTTDVELATVDADSSVVVRIKHDDKLSENLDAHFQVALLYTTALGERRIRVHTLSLRVCTDMQMVFRGADMETLACVLPRIAVKDARSVPLPALRQRLERHCVSILGSYRRRCTTSNASAGQLILPETLKLLPVYVGSMLKCTALRAGGDVSSDERMAAIFQMMATSPRRMLPFLYPRVIPIHSIDEGSADEQLPAVIRPSIARFKDHGCYLAEVCFLAPSTASDFVEPR